MGRNIGGGQKRAGKNDGSGRGEDVAVIYGKARLDRVGNEVVREKLRLTELGGALREARIR